MTSLTTRTRRREKAIFLFMGFLTYTVIGILLVAIMFLARKGIEDWSGWIKVDGIGYLGSQLVDTLLVIAGSFIIALPLGLATGVYLCEYRAHSKVADGILKAADYMAHIPPVIYGLFGWGIFVAKQQQVSAAALLLTLALWLLPKIISITSQALKSTPLAFRRESQALGASIWQTTFHAVLPYASSSIAAGALEAAARIAGEAIPVIMLASLSLELAIKSSGVLSYRLYESIVNSVRYSQETPYGVALLLLTLSLLLQLAAILVRRQETNTKYR